VYCPNCSAEAPTEQKFCRSCGLELEAVAGLISGQNIAKPPTPKQTFSGRERAMLIWGMILSLAALAAGSSLKILWNEQIQVAGDFTPYLLPMTLLLLFLGVGLMCYPYLRVMAPRARPGQPLSPRSERTTDLTPELPPEKPSITEQTTKFLEESEARIRVRDTAPRDE
jgi:hypothetical protein